MHFSPFQINTQLFFLIFFSKWPPAAILEVRFGQFWMTENHFRSHSRTKSWRWFPDCSFREFKTTYNVVIYLWLSYIEEGSVIFTWWGRSCINNHPLGGGGGGGEIGYCAVPDPQRRQENKGEFINHIMSICLYVCLCVCPANILVYYLSATRRDIDLKYIQDTYRVVLISLKKIELVYLPNGKYCGYPRMVYRLVIVKPPPPPPFRMTENEFRSHFSPFQVNTQFLFIFYFVHKMAAGDHFGWQKITFDRIFSPFQINTQLLFVLNLFTKWLQAAILDDRKTLSIAFLAISDQYATFFFTKWLPAAILDDLRSLLIAFLAISDQYTTFICFDFFSHKMAASGHFGWPKMTFYHISRHFRSIHNFFLQNGCQRPSWMTENHFWSHFPPFQINIDFFFHKMAAGGHFGWPKILSNAFLAISDQYGTFFLNFFFKMAAGGHFGSPTWAILDDRKSLSIAFLAISDKYTTFLFKMAASGHFGCPICAKNNRVLPLCVNNGYAKYEVDRLIYDTVRDATSVLNIFIQNGRQMLEMGVENYFSQRFATDETCKFLEQSKHYSTSYYIWIIWQ